MRDSQDRTSDNATGQGLKQSRRYNVTTIYLLETNALGMNLTLSLTSGGTMPIVGKPEKGQLQELNLLPWSL